ncbi:HmuY family protein [Capnocytophaga sp.]|uniref:HmuY family protein n=1 Tax=Capnocytophaga sp. TaxID=44737 RepID=UPI0026DBB67A|nr:HmuY family protein [Capnocytophaga sp.]MDO5104352.1 HmuY family protein [Capnocytophaga sp.]
MKMKIVLLLVCVAMLGTTACKKENKDNQLVTKAKEYKNLSVPTTDWVYFSFEKNQIVPVTDPDKSTDWDIAFNQYDVKTRGALNTRLTAFDQVTQAPKDGYVSDVERYTFSGRTVSQNQSSPVISMGYTESFWQFISERGLLKNISENLQEDVKKTLVHNNGWQTFSYVNNRPTFVQNNWIYVVKTAKNKYAKLHIYSYTNEKNEAFYISFRYQIADVNHQF